MLPRSQNITLFDARECQRVYGCVVFDISFSSSVIDTIQSSLLTNALNVNDCFCKNSDMVIIFIMWVYIWVKS